MNGFEAMILCMSGVQVRNLSDDDDYYYEFDEGKQLIMGCRVRTDGSVAYDPTPAITVSLGHKWIEWDGYKDCPICGSHFLNIMDTDIACITCHTFVPKASWNQRPRRRM